MPTYKIAIPEACPEKWEEMQPTGCGAYCGSCQKEVIDFTNKSYTEIAKIIHQSKGHLCGRLTPAQMQVEYEYQPLVINNNWFRKGLVGAGLTLLVAATQVSGQAPKTIEPTKKEETINTLTTTLSATAICGTGSPEKITITGTLVDDKTGEPLIFAAIIVNKEIAVTADINGKFRLEIPQSAITNDLAMTIRLLGYNPMVMKIDITNPEQHFDIELTAADARPLGGVIIVSKSGPKHQADRFYFGMR